MLRTATGSAPIKVNKADVADPERFRNLMNTLEREKVRFLTAYSSAFTPAIRLFRVMFNICNGCHYRSQNKMLVFVMRENVQSNKI